jgi:hypothetical protein
MQQYAVYILFYCNITLHFGCRPHPSSGAHKTVVTATGTSHMIVQLPHSNVANLATLEWGSYTVPVTVTTVLCTPDDWCGRHPKHVEWYCSNIKYRKHIVASRWTFIDILVVSHRSFGTTRRSHLQGSSGFRNIPEERRSHV